MLGNTKNLGCGKFGFASSIASLTTTYIVASGGIVTRNGNYVVHYLLSTTDFIVSQISNNSFYNSIDVDIVAGGGGGGYEVGGGGSGGQLRKIRGHVLSSTGTYNGVVGAGGAGGTGVTLKGSAGGSSSIFGYTSVGGGGGGGWPDAVPTAGAYGGGATGYSSSAPSRVGASGTVANKGGDNNINTAAATGGGGGGAGASGQDSQSGASTFASGGTGDTSTLTGITVTYSAGGKGVGDSYTGGAAGMDNTGNGGDGGGNPSTGKDGGSGIIVISYYSPVTIFETSTINYMSAVGVAYDSTIYFPSTIYAITGADLWFAFNNVFYNLSAWSLSAKLKAFWVYFGISSSTAKWNLMNLTDSDAAFRATFFGGITFSGIGATTNGSTGYAMSHIVPNVDLSQNDAHVSWFGNTAAGNYVMGSYNGTTDRGIMLRRTTTATTTDNYLNSAPFNALGGIGKFGMLSRNNSSNVDNYVDNSITTVSSTSTALISVEMALMAYNNNGSIAIQPASPYMAHSVGNGFTQSQGLNFRAINQKLMQDLHRV